MLRIRIRRTRMFLDLPDPDPDPSLFVRTGFGSGSGSFKHQAKIVRKTLISTVLWLLHDFISWKNDVNVPSKVISKNIFCLLLEDPWQKEQHPLYGSADPDPYQNGTDPQHWLHVSNFDLLPPMLRIHDILLWIRIWIRGSMPLANGSGCGPCYFRHWPSRCQQKTIFCFKVFLLIAFWRHIYTIFQKEVTKHFE